MQKWNKIHNKTIEASQKNQSKKDLRSHKSTRKKTEVSFSLIPVLFFVFVCLFVCFSVTEIIAFVSLTHHLLHSWDWFCEAQTYTQKDHRIYTLNTLTECSDSF